MSENDTDHEILIRMDVKINNICEKLQELPSLEKRVRDLEISQSNVGNLEKDIDDLKKKSDAWSVINSVGVFIAGILGLAK